MLYVYATFLIPLMKAIWTLCTCKCVLDGLLKVFALKCFTGQRILALSITLKHTFSLMPCWATVPAKLNWCIVLQIYGTTNVYVLSSYWSLSTIIRFPFPLSTIANVGKILFLLTDPSRMCFPPRYWLQEPPIKRALTILSD